MTTHEQVNPALTEGETVYYLDSKDKGRVTRIIPVTSYEYEVEWEDGEPKVDIYPASMLTPVS